MNRRYLFSFLPCLFSSSIKWISNSSQYVMTYTHVLSETHRQYTSTKKSRSDKVTKEKKKSKNIKVFSAIATGAMNPVRSEAVGRSSLFVAAIRSVKTLSRQRGVACAVTWRVMARLWWKWWLGCRFSGRCVALPGWNVEKMERLGGKYWLLLRRVVEGEGGMAGDLIWVYYLMLMETRKKANSILGKT